MVLPGLLRSEKLHQLDHENPVVLLPDFLIQRSSGTDSTTIFTCHFNILFKKFREKVTSFKKWGLKYGNTSSWITKSTEMKSKSIMQAVQWAAHELVCRYALMFHYLGGRYHCSEWQPTVTHGNNT